MKIPNKIKIGGINYKVILTTEVYDIIRYNGLLKKRQFCSKNKENEIIRIFAE